MPELPDIVVYVESLERRIVGQTLDQIRLNSPFVLRTAVPPLSDVAGKPALGLRRIGNAIALVRQDFASWGGVAYRSDAQGRSQRGAAPLCLRTIGIDRMDGAAARGNRKRISDQGDCLPATDGGARPLRPALPRLRRAHTADR